MTNYCEDCEHIYDDTKGHPRYWMCTKHKNPDSNNFVSTKKRLSEPYMYCKDVNKAGACPLFKDKELNQTKLNLEE